MCQPTKIMLYGALLIAVLAQASDHDEAVSTWESLPADAFEEISNRISSRTTLTRLGSMSRVLREVTRPRMQLLELFDQRTPLSDLPHLIVQFADNLAANPAAYGPQSASIEPEQALVLYDRLMYSDELSVAEKSETTSVLITQVNPAAFRQVVLTLGYEIENSLWFLNALPDWTIPPLPAGFPAIITNALCSVSDRCLMMISRIGFRTPDPLDPHRPRFPDGFDRILFPFRVQILSDLVKTLRNVRGPTGSANVLADRNVLLTLLRYGLRFDLGTFLQLHHIPDAVLAQVFGLLRYDERFLQLLKPCLDPSLHKYQLGEDRKPPRHTLRPNRRAAKMSYRCIRYLPALFQIPEFIMLLRRNDDRDLNLLLAYLTEIGYPQIDGLRELLTQ